MIRSNKGFTMVELIVSVALLAVILVPVAGFFTNSFRIQGRTSMKTNITRVGQYIIENFKNKNYLTSSDNDDENLRNDEGTTFEEFLDTVWLDGTGTEEDPYVFSDTDTDITAPHDWEISYNGVDYKVKITLKDFKTTDIANSDIPDKNECAWVMLDADGTFKYSNKSKDTIDPYVIGESYSYNITKSDGTIIKSYTENNADYPTVILKHAFAPDPGKVANLWIENTGYYNSDPDRVDRKETVRIIKEFPDELHVYKEGTDFTVGIGQPEDGAPAAYKKISEQFLGEDASKKEQSESELLLDATMEITNMNDDTVKDTFEFSFPIDYDYSKEEEIR